MAVVKRRQSGALAVTLVRIELLAPVTLRLVPDGIGSRRAAIGIFLVSGNTPAALSLQLGRLDTKSPGLKNV
jgi:hypothetical protein